MSIYHWILFAALMTCLASCLYHFFRVVRKGAPTDHAKAKGGIAAAVKYSFTRGMSPAKKETAFLHLPTYAAGIVFHMGTFLSLFLLILIFFNVDVNLWIACACVAFLILSCVAGIGILVKRISSKKMRGLSNPDDYISNLLVCGFQALVALSMIRAEFVQALLICAALLFLYIPLGKLRHTVYFFTSRYHLGVFYGRRGTWPVKKQKI
ncbi:MAG: hypothetical protein U9R60_00900 [Bacteroidota bacterium]|nr:hypothetical protein [Bacteroidota bacterium]